MEEKEIGPYIVERFLGQGATGKVLLARHKDDQNQKVAIKVIKKISFHDKKNLQAKVQREISLMRLIRHPNIINLIDVLESENNLYIILEYAEQGELFDYLIVNRFLCADVAIEFFRQIIFAIEYLHNHGICHRDLKPENILLDKSMRIKIADFGFARWVKSELLTDPCGSPHYAAPEVLSGKPYDGKAADVWSVGIILFALVAVCTFFFLIYIIFIHFFLFSFWFDCLDFNLIILIHSQIDIISIFLFDFLLMKSC
ncbi:CAMK family protein kinase [Tritrichomonas foetus]|uniref:CAMK family protein kinase n=1 Tax=Tritrichomonas foetus TaxID=1144522 RepID=A0A1J4JS32_9EUKA|nr:CAMK family protein kinase [Tritrichomonas foetus]|eukprot:OHT01562.1 CAMK family protein kinase [Tritrichomonas foetus]